jgi:DinB superfamily
MLCVQLCVRQIRFRDVLRAVRIAGQEDVRGDIARLTAHVNRHGRSLTAARVLNGALEWQNEFVRDPRFPIGELERQQSYSSADRAALIESLEHLPALLRKAVAGLSHNQLEETYRTGGWTIRQTVHHLVDSHLNEYIRFKLALTEAEPTITPWNEAAWAELSDSSYPIEPTLILLEVLHERLLFLLRSIEVADWERGFVHPEYGRTTLTAALVICEWHARHHLTHITVWREARDGFNPDARTSSAAR